MSVLYLQKNIKLLISLVIMLPVFVFGQAENHIKIKATGQFSNVKAGGDFELKLKVNVDELWHINSDKPNEDYLIPTRLRLKDVKKDFVLSGIKYPAGRNIKLGFSDKPLSVFEGEFIITGTVRTSQKLMPGRYIVSLELDYQACNNSSCLAPDSAMADIVINITGGANGSVPAENTAQQTVNPEETAGKSEAVPVPVSDESDSLASKLESGGLFLSLLIVFLGGLALNLTPCVYPLIPITVGYFGGQSEGKTGRLFILGVLYVLGLALTYSVIGVVTALSGAVFGALLQNTFVLLAIAGVLTALSLSMFGLYEFKLPDALVAKAGGAKGGYFGAFFMGLTLGIVAAPCIGPFVLGLVTYVAAKADPYFGFMMFFFLALGMGLPYLVLALFSGKIKNLPRAGYWMEAVKHIFGFILLGMALYFLVPVLPKSIAEYVLPVYMLLVSLYLMFVDRIANSMKGFRIFKIVLSVVIIVVSGYMLFPKKEAAPKWIVFSEQSYVASLRSNQPMIIDFYADWCIPCKELDGITFSDRRIINESGRFSTYKVDMTKSLSETTEKMRNKFKILGMPTVLIINSKGKEVHRITGFVDAERFYQIMRNVN
ncbi:MAG: cytochrome c biogenesis protein CcdA [Ignavibacteria bacterium]